MCVCTMCASVCVSYVCMYECFRHTNLHGTNIPNKQN